MSKPHTISVIVLAGILSACGESPSDLGAKVQERLAQQKAEFESSETRRSFTDFIDNHYHWTPEAKSIVVAAFDRTVSISRLVSPEKIRDAIEGGEMGIACLFTILGNEAAIDDFTSDVVASIDDVESKMSMLETLTNAKIMVMKSIITRENCSQ
ncbi:hypothetical protein [Thalassolituus marinus]|uniref:Lipoprotein n=1 Tax=Thalassolituus marinus TaxID=671053 RepID=A0ABS7ZUE8_9GAMM|nr:hypothetical protein [Thalassolituus marinus]MCA6065381.1 hypothetical protein [Thalassolituus marinus]